MSTYLAIKTLHLTTVCITAVLFLTRFFWMLSESPRRNASWVKIVPHVNDSLLLISGITLAVMLGQYPLAQAWLTMKLLAVLVYIVLGSIALKRGRTLHQRLTAGILGIVCFGYILIVALYRQPLPY